MHRLKQTILKNPVQGHKLDLQIKHLTERTDPDRAIQLNL